MIQESFQQCYSIHFWCASGQTTMDLIIYEWTMIVHNIIVIT